MTTILGTPKRAPRPNGEGGYQTRPKDGWVRGAKRIDGVRRWTKWYPTKLAASDALRALKAPEVEPVVENAQTLADAVRAFIIENGVDAGTRGSYEYALQRYIGPELGDKPIADITTVEIGDMYRRLARAGRALSVLRQTRAVIYGAFGYAVFHGWAPTHVALGIKMPVALIDDPENVEGFPDDERAKLLVAMTGTRYEARHRLAIELALRPSEAVGLRWSRVDFKRGLIKIDGQLQRMRVLVDDVPLGTVWKAATKSSAGERTLKPGPRTMALLAALKMEQEAEHAAHPLTRAQLEKRAAMAARMARAKELELLAKPRRYEVPPDDLCFTLSNGDPILQARDTVLWAQMCERAGVGHRSLYSVRHTGISWLLRQGADMLSVSVMAGHTDAAFTARVYGDDLSPRSHDLSNYFEEDKFD